MSQILINIGSQPNDGQGDSLRDAFSNVNANFTELYNKVGGNIANATTIPSLIVTSDLFSSGNTRVQSNGFYLTDTTLTRKVYFNISSVTSGTTRTLSLPNADTTIVGTDYPQILSNKTINGAQNTFSNISLTSAVTGVLPIANGGTGGLLTPSYGGTGVSATPNNGQILIGNGAGFSLSTLTAGTGIAITNLSGQVVIENTGGGGGSAVTNAISDGTTSVVASNTSGTVTTTVRGSQTMVANANVSIFSSSVQLAPGSTSRAPLVFPSGALLTAPLNGAVEFDSTKLYITVGGVRKQLATYDQITAGAVTTFNGRTGTVTLSSADVNTALTYVPLSSNTGGNIGGSIRVTGNITTQNAGGTGGFGNILTGNIVASNSITASTLTGIIQTNAQPNITSVGTLTSLTLSGNITTTGNVSGNNITGTLTTASQPNITSVGYLSGLNMAGNLVMNSNFISGMPTPTADTHATPKSYVDTQIAAVPRNVINNGTTTVTTNYSDVAIAILGSNALTVTSANLTMAGNLVATKNANIGSNIGVGNVIATGTIIGASQTITGNITASNIVSTGITGTLQTSAQPNITSTGNLTVAGLTTSARIAPSANTSIDIGTTTSRFNNVYGMTFVGVATTAKYADLAEKYTTDQEYSVGTVVAVGGTAEVTACQVNDLAIGVISEAPAYLMNSEAAGQAIALKGRVPVKVFGPVAKGQRLIAGPDGSALAVEGTHMNVFAVALESNDVTEVKLVEAVIL